MLEWSLACTRGTWVLCRILRDSIHLHAYLELAPCQCQKETTSCTRLLCTGWVLDEKCLHVSYVWSDIIALIPIRKKSFLFKTSWQMRWWPSPLRSVTATSALTSAECQRHTSSIWPWSGMPKVCLYYTILSSLRQHVGNLATSYC